MSLIHILVMFILLVPTALAGAAGQDAKSETAQPVFRLDVPDPTADKPQSKIWYSRGCWWTCLPTLNGNQIWHRTAAGWSQVDDSFSPVRGLFGHGDVCAEQDQVQIVLVSPQELTVVVMSYDEGRSGYVKASPPTTWTITADGGVETATITKDATGRLWVAWDAGQSIWARASNGPAGVAWTDPILLGSHTSKDDICAITNLPGGVGTIWTNQNTDSVLFRFHHDGAAADIWDQAQIVARGSKTADDHLNCAVTEDGTLYVATKTSLDTLNRPQLSLRQRDPNGQWQSHPYAALSPHAVPTRPIVLVSSRPQQLVLCHTFYGNDEQKERVNSIRGLFCRHPNPDPAIAGIDLLQASTGLSNVTGCKSSLPINVPSIVLASDQNGHVYEAKFNVRTIGLRAVE
ncbi:MAG: hypothetical protein MK102_19165 [Fuerstiella sp.]|nr:hypothetical protein [Fuerstiella sp.]